MNSELKARIFLNHVRDLGPVRFHEITQAAGSAVRILEMKVKDLIELGVADARADFWAEQFRDPKIEKAFEDEWRRIESGEFRAISELDPDYPETLKELADRPPVLYVKGIWPVASALALGIVGTRHPTPYGICAAERFTLDFVRKGAITVSGLAAGIDTCVHRTTLKENGLTVAVLGHGFEYQYPSQNKDLFAEIAERGTLVTEFPFETGPDARHFPRRNRIISGLSRGVVVVEAGRRSGALITARYAAEQGRDVFVIPGSIYSQQSRGCHQLIKEGARLVETTDEVLADYGFTARATELATEPASEPAAPSLEGLSSAEIQVVKLLSSVPVSVDELGELSGVSIHRLAEVLLSLEIKGRIRAMPGQQYVSN